MGKVRDYGIKVGDKFGKWTVMEIDKVKKIKSKDRPGGYRLKQSSLCRCSCKHKTIKIIENTSLFNNKSKSCKKCINKKFNKYNISGDFGVGYTRKGEEFYFDKEDYDKIKDFCWHMHWDTHNGYLRTCISSENKKNKYTFMHRIIFDDIPKNKYVDHINHKTNDNRKKNLRIVSHSENITNIIKRTNSNKTTGVSFSKTEKKYKAYIAIDKKQIHLGTFEFEIDAIKTRLEAELKYYKEFAPQRHLFEEYNIGIDLNE